MLFDVNEQRRFPIFFISCCVQVMVTNVTSLLKTVKAVEDEATRGTRALEATIECIKQELTVRTHEGPVFVRCCNAVSPVLHIYIFCLFALS